MSHNKVIYKRYDQNQLNLIPANLEDMIPEDHIVRLVNKVIERLDISSIESTYKKGGTSIYHPRMLLKVVVYGYLQKIYSSRRITKALREDIHFMWLSGNNRPDFRTINNFRSKRLKGSIDKVFSSIFELLLKEGYVKYENYFLDGTKIEANANKYSYVWKKSNQKYLSGIKKKIAILIGEIEKTNEDENREYGDRDLEEMGEEVSLDDEKLEEFTKELGEKLKGNPEDKKLKKADKKLREEYLPKYEKYKKQEEQLQGRNSCSKTDPDATFMRMKEDSHPNSNPKAAYNVQMGTENQFITGYSVHQSAGDTNLLIAHLEQQERLYGIRPKNIIADAGYGSQENYEYLREKYRGIYVKYNMYDREKKRKYIENIFRVENLRYDAQKDIYFCPAGNPMKYVGTERKTTVNGYKTAIKKYKAKGCRGCTLRSECHKSRYNRVISVTPEVIKYRKEVKKNLDSAKGEKLIKQRPVDVESVFGHIKWNRNFRRFNLRGLDKVKVEFGLVAIAHNLKKMAKMLTLTPCFATI